MVAIKYFNIKYIIFIKIAIIYCIQPNIAKGVVITKNIPFIINQSYYSFIIKVITNIHNFELFYLINKFSDI